MNLAEVQKVTGGKLSGMNADFNSISIDTRTMPENALFIAITGPNFNGNNFVKTACQKKAIAAIVTEPVSVDLPLLQVRDSRIALGQMGALNRQKSDACVIALTGSQGKTTVKEMTAEILKELGEVVYTKGNLNNDYGVPLSLLKIGLDHEYAVIELGASGPGEIAYSVGLTKPKIAHITNIAPTHLEGFGSLEGVAKAKAELWDGLEPDGVAVINYDDPYASQWQKKAVNGRQVTISAQGFESADYKVSKKKFNADLTSDFILHAPSGVIKIHLGLPGEHNIANALAAAALSMEAGANIENVKAGLQRVMPVAGRLCHKNGLHQSKIIDDSYNASPASFVVAIDVLSSLPGRKIIAMGDMGELGDDGARAHQEVGTYAKKHGIDFFFTTGGLSQNASEAFAQDSENKSNHTAQYNMATLATKIISLLDENTTVLVKGSRSARMDNLVQLLIANEGEG